MLNLLRNINPEQKHIHDRVDMGNGIIAERFAILTTSLVDYQVWEPSVVGFASHTTITTIDGEIYGSMTSRPLPPEIDALPGWIPGQFWPEERIAAVRAYHADLERQAETLIKAAFPQDF